MKNIVYLGYLYTKQLYKVKFYILRNNVKEKAWKWINTYNFGIFALLTQQEDLGNHHTHPLKLEEDPSEIELQMVVYLYNICIQLILFIIMKC
jgi:hypothetical protein